MVLFPVWPLHRLVVVYVTLSGGRCGDIALLGGGWGVGLLGGRHGVEITMLG